MLFHPEGLSSCYARMEHIQAYNTMQFLKFLLFFVNKMINFRPINRTLNNHDSKGC